MLNIRTVALSVSLLVVLFLTAGLVNVRTEVALNASSDAASVSGVQEQSAIVLDHPHTYRSQFGECYDVSIRDLAACRAEGQPSGQPERPPLDECFDVAISEIASCRAADQGILP